MPGQLTIRLPDSIIEELNGIAKKEKVTRAMVIRQCLEIGLSTFSNTQSTNVATLIHEGQKQILEAIRQLEATLGSPQIDSKEHSTDAIQAIQMNTIEPMPSADTRHTAKKGDHPIEVVAADDDAGRHATLVTARPVTPTVQRSTSNFYLDADGQVRTDRRKATTRRNQRPEQRVGARLRKVRERKGWSIQDMADALNITTDLMEDIESGRRGLPGSRALRAEAKLQQWEATVTQTQVMNDSDV